MLTNDYVVEERLSAWQKKRVRTIIVNSRSRVLSRRTIAGAIAIAKPYERIELVGGEYFETLSISIPLEIVAAEGEDPCIVSRGTCVTLTQDVEVYFEHVELMSKSKSRLEPSVALLNGRSVFFRCKMNSVLVGGFAKTHLEHCTITESYNGYGLQIGDCGGAEVQKCTIHTHHLACVEIDTKGVVMMRENTFRQPSNGGDVVSVRATHSFSDDHTSPENLACRRVTVTKCHIYVTSDFFRPKDRDWVNENVSRQPSCVVISRGACPVFTYNELLQGFIGFTLEFAGSAVLEGNCIYNQKSCGILAIVGDRYSSYESKQVNLRISGGNLIDRCVIGVDVQSAGKLWVPTSMDTPLVTPSQDIPSSRSSFSWLEKIQKMEERGGPSSCSDYSDIDKTPLRVNGKSIPLGQLKECLRSLAKMVSAEHPTHFRCSDSAEGRQGGGVLNPLGELLEETLQIQVPHPSSSTGELQKLRGVVGVDILDTRFTSCGSCAIRFGHDRHGLVEDCDFVRCGATAIVVGSGARPLIVGCKFNQSKGAGILVENFANPLIVGNEILSNTEHGVEFCNMSRGVLMGNFIVGNAKSGICVTCGSNTIIAGNSIKQSSTAGVISSGGSKPLIVMNKFISNQVAQLHVSEFSAPFIACNTFTGGSGAGLRFESCSGGTVIGNHIMSNDRGIVVELDADPYVVSNKILNNLRSGVAVENNGLGTFLLNEIAQNGGCNILVQEGGSPVIRNNEIKGGQSGGMVVIAEGLGIIEHNCITDNAMGNVIVLDKFTHPVVTSNTISCSSSGGGIICGRDSDGQFTRNSIFQNKQCGVYVIGKANPMIFNNTIFREAIGILLSHGGSGIFKNNVIHSSFSTGVIIQMNADPVMEGNKIFKCFLSGLLVAADGCGTVSNNEFFENDVGVQLGSSVGVTEVEVGLNFLSSTSNPISANNKTKLSRSRRVLVPRESNEIMHGKAATPTLVHQNKIYANTTCGVLLEGGAWGVMEDNDIESNAMYGIMADMQYSTTRVTRKLGEKTGYNSQRLQQLNLGNASAVIRKNRIGHHKHSNIAILNYGENNISIALNDVYNSPIGVYMANNSTIHSIEGNTIRNCFDGVYTESRGRGCFEENKIYDCDGVGVYVCDGANPQFTRNNSIKRCQVSGIFIDADGKGVFEQATVRQCSVGVVVYTSTPLASVSHAVDVESIVSVTSSPTFENCVIEQNTLHGILLLTVLTGSPLRLPSSGASTTYRTGDFSVSDTLRTPASAKFQKNIIQNNCHFGVCHEFYDPDDFNVQETRGGDKSNETKPPDLAATASSPFSKALDRGYSRLSSTYSQPFPQVLKPHTLRRYSMQEALARSTFCSPNKQQQEWMQSQVSFVDNIISNCSIGVVVGSWCHSFFLGNRIHNNTFFGMLLRSNANAMCSGCELVENGLAGLYAARGSLGAFTGGVMARNNGFCRPDGSPNDPRSFEKFSFMQPIKTKSACFESDEGLSNSYATVWNVLEQYADVVADGLHLLCEVVVASSAALSLASGVSPNTSFDNTMKSFGSLLMDGHDHCWAVDGGMGVWVEQGSMTDVNENLVESNRNVGVFFSRGISQHHQNLVHHTANFTGRLPSIPGGEVISGTMRKPRSSAMSWTLFSSSSLSRDFPRRSHRCSGSDNNNSGNRNKNSKQFLSDTRTDLEDPLRLSKALRLPFTGDEANNTSQMDDENLLAMLRPAAVRRNHITKNGHGIIIHMFHVMRADASDVPAADGECNESLQLVQSNLAKKTSAQRKGKKAQKVNQGSTALAKVKTQKPSAAGGGKAKKVLEMCDVVPLKATQTSNNTSWRMLKPMEMENIKFAVCMEENHVYENTGMGILGQHVVEVLCGHLVTSRMDLDIAARHYDDVCVKVTLKNELTLPDLLFKLVPHEQMICNARVSENEIYKNVGEQMQVTSRYIAVTQDQKKTLLHIDTLRQPSASMCSSQALLRIPLFASLTMTTPPGLLLVEKNRFRDSLRGLHLLGILGGNSISLRENTFHNISGNAILLEGHLASATIGTGNVFESNEVSIRVVMPDDRITEEDRQRQEEMGVITRIHGNYFSTGKILSVVVEGGGSPPPNISENTFCNHKEGSVAFFLSGLNATARLKGNFFCDNYIPVIITNFAGVSKSGTDGAVVVRENYFLRNYIGLLICGGAAPRIMYNLFEANYRAGLEIMGGRTKVFVQHCVFAMNKGSLLSASETENFLSTNDGGLRIHGVPWSGPKLTPENMSPDGSSILSTGILVHSECGGTVDSCLFKDNDVGLFVLCNAASTAGVLTRSSSSSSARLVSCLFTASSVAAVWVRSSGSKGGNSNNNNNAGSENTALDGNKGMEVPSRRPSEDEGDAEDTTFDGCFFLGNACDAEQRGDVIATDGGVAVFRGNIFTGCIHGCREGAVLFERNMFISVGLVDAAVYLHKATRIRLVGNTIRGHKRGIITFPGAWGHLDRNWIFETTQCVSAAPFCHTLFTGNRMLKANECGLTAYGGVFMNNEISGCPIGVVVRNAIEYKDYNLIPAFEKTTFDTLFSENRVHSCDSVGVVIYGGARIEGNAIFNTKNNMNVFCRPRQGTGTSVVSITSNAVFDGEVGVLVAKGSESIIRDNDIFDNSMVGVCLQAGASGVLQGNNISTSMREGALEMETGSEVKAMYNTIRNQFSPSYHKTLPPQREKERQRAAEALVLEMQEINRTCENLLFRCVDLETTLESVVEGLCKADRSTQSSTASAFLSMAGSPSRALRSNSMTRTSGILDLLNASLSKTSKQQTVEKGMNAMLKISRSVAQRTGRSGSIKRMCEELLIHVLSVGGEKMDAIRLGKEVETGLSSLQLTAQMMIHTTITTDYNGLSSFLASKSPDVAVVVFHSSMRGITGEMGVFLRDLEQLQPSSLTGKKRTSNASAVYVLTLLPLGWKFTLDQFRLTKRTASAEERGIMEFAATHNPVYYNESVAEAVSEMERLLEARFPMPSLAVSETSIDATGAAVKTNA